MVAQEVRHLVHPHTGQFLHRRPVDDRDDACLAQTTAATIPLGRLARSQEIADEIEFVASERAGVALHGPWSSPSMAARLCPLPESPLGDGPADRGRVRGPRARGVSATGARQALV
jgi:hypothetical protein